MTRPCLWAIGLGLLPTRFLLLIRIGRDMINTIVIGGGQAGVVLSYFLQQRGVEHLVLERDQAFSAWHKCWDNFRLNTANWMNALPGMREPFAPHKAWYDTATRDEVLNYFSAYIQMVDPPIKEGATVLRVVEGQENCMCIRIPKSIKRPMSPYVPGTRPNPLCRTWPINCRAQLRNCIHRPIATPRRSKRECADRGQRE